MCGIVALFKRKDLAKPLSLAQAMSDRVEYRGPDGAGLIGVEDGGVTRCLESTTWRAALAHRRLAIIDPSPSAAQPMVYRGRYWLTYNGEVYNYLELRSELEKLGHRFRTRSDAEVVLAAFAEWGARCFEQMRGMWGLVLLDVQSGRAVVCRDRLGIKPLYIWRGGGLVAVVSEIKQLFELPGFSPIRSDESVAEYLATGYEDQTRTFFRGVDPLPPGTFLTVPLNGEASSNEEISSAPQTYWWPERIEPSVFDPEEAGEAFAAKLEECVRIQSRSDVPVGCTVSGGLDSSTIAGLLNKTRADADGLRTFTSTCAGEPAEEREYAEAVIDRIRAKPHFVEPTAASFLEDLEKFVWYHDEPVGSLSMYAGYCVARTAREANVPVVLSGQGGDEILSGYWQSYFLYLRELALQGRLFSVSAHLAGALLPHGNRFLIGQFPAMLRRYISRREGGGVAIVGRKTVKSEVLGRALAGLGQSRRLNEIRMLYLPRLLKWDDRNSMAFSVETRYPFLDHELVDLCLSFASDLLYRRGWTKWPLRLGLQEVLPAKVASRRSKFGFWVPQDQWLRGPLRPVLTRWLNRDRPLWDCVERSIVGKLADATWQSRGHHDESGQALVRCFMLDRWLEVFNVA